MRRSIRQYGLIALTLSLMLAGAALADSNSGAGEVTNAVAPATPGANGAPGAPGASGMPSAPGMNSAGMSAANVSAASANDSNGGTDATAAPGDSGATSDTGLKNTGGEPLVVSMLGMLALGSGLVLRRKLA